MQHIFHLSASSSGPLKRSNYTHNVLIPKNHMSVVHSSNMKKYTIFLLLKSICVKHMHLEMMLLLLFVYLCLDLVLD